MFSLARHQATESRWAQVGGGLRLTAAWLVFGIWLFLIFGGIGTLASASARFPPIVGWLALTLATIIAFVTMERGAVRYAARSTSLRQAGAWISPRSSIPIGSVAHQIRSSGNSATETDEVSQDIWFDNWEKGLDLWELARHYAYTDTTISLLWFDCEDLPEVEINRFGERSEDGGGLAELTGELPWPGRSRRR